MFDATEIRPDERFVIVVLGPMTRRACCGRVSAVKPNPIAIEVDQGADESTAFTSAGSWVVTAEGPVETIHRVERAGATELTLKGDSAGVARSDSRVWQSLPR
jgi:hypothetical protein